MNIPLPIKACGACEQAYDLEDWRALKLWAVLDRTEERECTCGARLRLDLAGLAELDLEISAHQYAELYGGSSAYLQRQVARMREVALAEARRRRRYWLGWCCVMFLLVAVLAAAIAFGPHEGLMLP
jgi:hypothetical protein